MVDKLCVEAGGINEALLLAVSSERNLPLLKLLLLFAAVVSAINGDVPFDR